MVRVVLDAAVLAVGAAASWWDVRCRRVPNALTAGGLAAALVLHGAAAGLPGLASAALGALVGGVPFTAFWLLGWCGAGDAKLAAALGALLGWPLAVTALTTGALAGGAAGATLLAWAAARRTPDIARGLRRHGIAALSLAAADPLWSASVPYAVFLSLGAVAAAALSATGGRL